MKKSILEIYAMAICFVTLVIFCVTLGIGLYNIVQISNPRLTMNSWDWERFSNNDTYFNNNSHLFSKTGTEFPDRSQFTEEEITKRREESLKLAIEVEKRSAMQSIVRVLIFLLISSVVFLLHWKLAKNTRKE